MIYLFSFIVSLFFSFLFWKLGEKWQILDHATDDPLKIHKKSVSCLGGLSMFFTLTLALFFECRFFTALVAGLLIFSVGLADDLRWRDKKRVKPIYKLAFLVLFSFLSALIISTNVFAIAVFLFVFVLINAVNYQDGTDGLAAGTTIISLIGFALLAHFYGNAIVLGFCLMLLSVVLGFFVFNFPPAKIFMGDSGAYFLGFNLAFISVSLLSFNILNILSTIFILGLPLFDGIFTNIRRIIKGKSILKGDRGHFYDMLLGKGFSSKKTLLICLSVQLLFVSLGLLIYFF